MKSSSSSSHKNTNHNFRSKRIFSVESDQKSDANSSTITAISSTKSLFASLLSPSKKKFVDFDNNADQAQATTKADLFEYTFSFGRGPLSEPLQAHCVRKNDGYDVTRVYVSDNTGWTEKDRTIIADKEEATTKRLWRELRGYSIAEGDDRKPPGYMHTEGVLSGPHGMGVRAFHLGESWMTRTSYDATEGSGAVTGVLSVNDGTSIRITSSATISDFFYSRNLISGYRIINEDNTAKDVVGVVEAHPEWVDYLNPDKPGAFTLADTFLSGRLGAEFNYRYVLTESAQRPDVYEWNRRLNSYILTPPEGVFVNVDEIEVLDLVVLAEKYRQHAIAEVYVADNAAMNGTAPSSSNRMSVRGFLPTLHLSPPNIADINPDFSFFAEIRSWQDFLCSDLAKCKTRYIGRSNEGDTGSLLFESSKIVLSSGLAQHATKTLQNIQADLYIRRVRLTFIEACLRDATLALWTADENKLGLLETLLNDLEHPVIESKEENGFINAIKMMRSDLKRFDTQILIAIVKHLFQQATQKATQLNMYCEELKKRFPINLWKTTQKLLNETKLTSQLTALAEHMNSDALAEFSILCDEYLVDDLNDRLTFKSKLKEELGQPYCPIVRVILNVILEISSQYKPYRKNFLAISDEELKVAEGFDPYLMYTIKKILLPRERLIQSLKQVEKLNAYYVLLSLSATWNKPLEQMLKDVIEKLQQETYIDDLDERGDSLEVRIEQHILDLSDDDHKILYNALCKEKLYKEKASCPSDTIDHYIEVLYKKLAEISLPQYSADTTDQVIQYFDEQYHRARTLPHGISDFDEVTDHFIEKKILAASANGIHSQKYKTALFIRHFYVGVLFGDYLRDKPQMDEPNRPFLYSRMITDNDWVNTHFSDVLSAQQCSLASRALAAIGAALRHVIQNNQRPQNYIDDFEYAVQQYKYVLMLNDDENTRDPDVEEILLQRRSCDSLLVRWIENGEIKQNVLLQQNTKQLVNLPEPGQDTRLPSVIREIITHCHCAPLLDQHLRLLGDEWATLMSIYGWASVLANSSHFFLQKTIDNIDYMDYVHKKIETILWPGPKVLNNSVLSPDLVQKMTVIWRTYKKLYQIQSSAVEEWMSSTEISFASIAQLYHGGANLFLNASALRQPHIFDKTLWLNFALRFHYAIKNDLEGKNRISCYVPDEYTQYIANCKMTAAQVHDASQVRRVYVGRIIGMILSNKNLPLSQQNEVYQCATDVFKDKTIRQLTLDNIVAKVNEVSDQEKKDDLIEAEVPNIVFFDEGCEIFHERSFSNTISTALSKSHIAPGFIAADDFFRKLQKALANIQEMTKTKKYHIFLPCLMGRALTSFSVVYCYLTVIAPTAIQNFIPKETPDLWSLCLEEIRNIGKNVSKGQHDYYQTIANMWEEIRHNIFKSVKLTDHGFNAKKIHADFHSLISVYVYCVKLKKAGFKTESAMGVIEGQWQKMTNYGINPEVAKALCFIFESLKAAFGKNNDDVLENFNTFLKSAVKKIQRSNDVLNITVSDDYLGAAVLMPLWKKVVSLEKMALALEKAYTARLQDGRQLLNFPVVFCDEKEKRCVEIYWNNHLIERKECLRSESYLMARHQKRLPIFKFFDLVLLLLQESMQVIAATHISSTPISFALLRSSSDIYDDPRVLSKCRRDELIGLFVLGLIYQEIARQIQYEKNTKSRSSVAVHWVCNLPRFFADHSSQKSKENIRTLAIEGIAQSKVLDYGLLDQECDPINKNLRELDSILVPQLKNNQADYVTWFKTTYLPWFKGKQTQDASIFSPGESRAAALK